MPAEAFAVHGLSSEFLADKPLFAQVVDEFLEFIADAPLVIHNASFDIGFINAELDRIKRPADSRATGWSTRCCWRGASIRGCRTGSTISARAMRSTIPAAPSTAPCSTPSCLAEVYIDLIGARQSQLILATETRDARAGGYGEMPRRSARCRSRRGSPMKIARPIGLLSPRWATSRSGTIFWAADRTDRSR